MAVEHSQDKRQLAAWVDRKLAETVDEVASKRGITRTAAITEALQRYVEEETSENALAVLETNSAYEHLRDGRYPCLIRHRKTLGKLLRHRRIDQR